MKINRIDIYYLSAGGMTPANRSVDGVRHEKILPYLSVVQSVRGRYRIALGDAPFETTQEGGCFIAPAGVKQSITHLAGSVGDSAEYQWVFLDAVVNHQYRLDSLYDFPLLLPADYQEEVGQLIRALRMTEDYCQRMLCGYRLIQLLLSIGKEKQPLPETLNRVLHDIHQNYAKPLAIAGMAQQAHISVSSLFHLFQQHLGIAPMAYVISYRLEQASLLLISSDAKIEQISEAVGFHNPFYFSKMFKKKYGCSPLAYRRQLQMQSKGSGTS